MEVKEYFLLKEMWPNQKLTLGSLYEEIGLAIIIEENLVN